MDLLAIGNHLLNFVAPACVVGWLLALAGAMCSSRGDVGAAPIGRLQRTWRTGWINTLSGGLASASALVVLGRDGETAAYAALVLAAASSQWLMLGCWRR